MPAAQSNPSWFGQLELFVTIPGANIVKTSLGSKDLTAARPLGVWKTIDFTVPASIQTALLGVHPNAQFSIGLSVPSCNGPTFIDNLRFTGTLRRREVFKETLIPLAPGPLFGFENLADWQATGAALARETSKKVEGNASLSVANNGSYVELTSRRFSNADAGVVKNGLQVDLFLPARTGTPWSGGVQGNLNCPSLGIYNEWLGRVAVSDLFPDEFNAVRLQPPAWATSLLKTRNYADCTIKLVLSIDSGRGTFLFDNLSFVD